jgi:hypothetical protein
MACTALTDMISQKINGVAGSFQVLAQSPTFGAMSIIMIACTVLIIVLTICLYFDTAWTNDPMEHGWLWVLCHFVYMLSLILLFQGEYQVFCAL